MIDLIKIGLVDDNGEPKIAIWVLDEVYEGGASAYKEVATFPPENFLSATTEATMKVLR